MASGGDAEPDVVARVYSNARDFTEVPLKSLAQKRLVYAPLDLHRVRSPLRVDPPAVYEAHRAASPAHREEASELVQGLVRIVAVNPHGILSRIVRPCRAPPVKGDVWSRFCDRTRKFVIPAGGSATAVDQGVSLFALEDRSDAACEQHMQTIHALGRGCHDCLVYKQGSKLPEGFAFVYDPEHDRGKERHFLIVPTNEVSTGDLNRFAAVLHDNTWTACDIARWTKLRPTLTTPRRRWHINTTDDTVVGGTMDVAPCDLYMFTRRLCPLPNQCLEATSENEFIEAVEFGRNDVLGWDTSFQDLDADHDGEWIATGVSTRGAWQGQGERARDGDVVTDMKSTGTILAVCNSQFQKLCVGGIRMWGNGDLTKLRHLASETGNARSDCLVLRKGTNLTALHMQHLQLELVQGSRKLHTFTQFSLRPKPTTETQFSRLDQVAAGCMPAECARCFVVTEALQPKKKSKRQEAVKQRDELLAQLCEYCDVATEAELPASIVEQAGAPGGAAAVGGPVAVGGPAAAGGAAAVGGATVAAPVVSGTGSSLP